MKAYKKILIEWNQKGGFQDFFFLFYCYWNFSSLLLVGTHFFSISGVAGVERCFLSQFWPCSHGLSWIMAVIAFPRCQRPPEALGEHVCRHPALSHSECQPWHSGGGRESHQISCRCHDVLMAGQGAGYSLRASPTEPWLSLCSPQQAEGQAESLWQQSR